MTNLARLPSGHPAASYEVCRLLSLYSRSRVVCLRRVRQAKTQQEPTRHETDDFGCRYHESLLGYESSLAIPLLRYTVKCCRTMSAFNSVLLPCAITAPLAITTYFSARRAAKWRPCSTNRIANRRECLKPMITSSI